MQDRNAKAPKVRSGDEVNPVIGTIVKISVLLVIAALIVLTTLIIVEFVKRNKKETNVFKDKIHITENDFKIITTSGNHDDLSNDAKEIMEDVLEDMDVYFFFYYDDLLTDYEKELKDIVTSRDDKEPLFLVNLNEKAKEDDEGNELPTLLDYLKTVADLSPASNSLEFNTILNRKNKYEYFLVVFNEEELNHNENPFTIETEEDVLYHLKTLVEKEEEE